MYFLLLHFIRAPELLKFKMGPVKSALLGAVLVVHIFGCLAADCPHPSYVYKHNCENCRNEAEALEFSLKRRGPYGVNTVFTGTTTFSIWNKNPTYCANNIRQVAYRCDLSAKRPYCRPLGRCFGELFRSTGHFDYPYIDCVH